MTRPGYLKWRTDLKKFHAERAGEILREVGYPDDIIARVQNLNLKKNFPDDPESRVLEDALCLVFLEHQFADLAAKTADDKVINALRKSWKKMTPAAHAEALKLSYSTARKSFDRRGITDGFSKRISNKLSDHFSSQLVNSSPSPPRSGDRIPCTPSRALNP